MTYRILADAVLVLHFGFILFVVFGGLLVFRWRRVMWVHLPAAVWGAAIEFFGWICPLTPLENHLRRLGQENGYEGGFIEYYIGSIIYPSGFSPAIHIAMGVGVVVLNVVIYWLALSRKGARQ